MRAGCWIAEWQSRSGMRYVVVDSRDEAIATLRENVGNMILSSAQIVGPYRLIEGGRWTYDTAEAVEESDDLQRRVQE